MKLRPKRKPHRREQSGVASGHRYACDVLKGVRPANDNERLAVIRHARDLRHVKEDPFSDYYFDTDEAERAIRFIENLPHTKGRWALGKRGKPGTNLIRLEPWQCFIVMSIFGWRERNTGLRRFRRIYLEIPRKNGKSILAAAIGLYMFLCDGEYGAEVYSGATKEKQAWEVFRPARLMCQRSPKLLAAFGVSVFAKSLSVAANGSRFEPLVGNPGDGASPHCAIIDEYHEHATDALYDAMQTGTGARDQSMILVITTAGDDISGPCFGMRADAIKMLNGTLADEKFFAIVFTLDVGDDWTTDEAIEKANPNVGVSVSYDYLRGQVRQAITSPRKSGSIKTKHFNIWVQSRNAYFPVDRWVALGNPNLTFDDVAHMECVASLDVAYKSDFCSMGKLFFDGSKYYFLSRHWLPETRIYDPANREFLEWYEKGHIQMVEGDVNDLVDVRGHIEEFAGQVQLESFALDPYKAKHFGQVLQDETGIPVVFYGQTRQSMSAPMKEVHDAILRGDIEHDGNLAMNWMMSNVISKPDAGDRDFPAKERAENKIDGAVALIMCMGRFMTFEEQAPVAEALVL